MEQQQAKEDLQFIRKVIEDSRRSVADNGMHYITWSICVALGIIGTYTVAVSSLSPRTNLWVWIVFIGAGWIFSLIRGTSQSSGKPKSFARKMLSSIWVCTGITMTITAFAGIISGTIQPIALPAVLSAILAIPYFIASYIYNLNWFKTLAAGWWLGAIVFFFWQTPQTLAAFGILMIVLQTIPGIYLYNKYGRQAREAA